MKIGKHTHGKLETDGRSVYAVKDGCMTNVGYCGSACGRDAECAANAQRIVVAWNAYDDLVTACQAGLAYDAAIQRHSKTVGLVDSEDLDSLYAKWISATIEAMNLCSEEPK